MNTIFNKLNYKGQPQVLVVNAPDSFLPELAAVREAAEVITDPKQPEAVDFAIVFAQLQSEVDGAIQIIGPKLRGDAVLWFAYPKKSSKQYSCEFNRDTGWAALGAYDLEGVRMVAIDADWSALRFRRVQYIKTMKRRFGALSDPGRERTRMDPKGGAAK